MRTTITVCVLACGLGLSIPAPDAAASTGSYGYDVLSAWDGTSATFRATGKESGEIRAAHPDDSGCILVGRIAP